MAVRPDDVSEAAREALLVEAYREGKLSHCELAQILGLDSLQTEAFLKRHNVVEDLPTLEEHDADLKTLRELLGRDR